MSTIVTRAGKGSPLTHTEADANFTNLNTDKLEINPALGTPVSGVLTNTTGLPISTGVAGLGANVATALAVAVGSAGAPVVLNGVLGTPSSGVATNLTGTAAGLTAGNVTTNANLTGHVTSTGNAAVLGSFTLAQLNTAVSDANLAEAGTNGSITALTAIADGTAGAPSIAHAGDTDTGIWFPGANTLAASVGGAERVRFPSTAGAMYLSAPNAGDTLELDFVASAVTRGFVSMNSSSGEMKHSAGYGGYGGIQTFWTNGAERLRIDSSGNVTVSMAALLGYGTGAGGAVIQATNKTTNVTLNAPSGKITMNNAALAAGAEALFALNNSLITETCTVTINHAGAGGTTYAYRVEVRTIVAGVAYIGVTNMTAGSLSEAVTLQFNVHKGATS